MGGYAKIVAVFPRIESEEKTVLLNLLPSKGYQGVTTGQPML